VEVTRVSVLIFTGVVLGDGVRPGVVISVRVVEEDDADEAAVDALVTRVSTVDAVDDAVDSKGAHRHV